MPYWELEVHKPKVKTPIIEDTKRTISVCGYCRVSTDSKDQRNSFAAQKSFFEQEFELHQNWLKKTVFADEGISGTSLEKRDEFNRMIDLALEGEYDLIITKDVSRFSRNLQVTLNTVTKLRANNVYVWFMLEDINTEDIDYRERLIEVGNHAEAESRKISKKVKWGHSFRMRQGVVFGRKDLYGYEIVKDEFGNQTFKIIEEEAKIVRRIFEMFVSGMGTFQIAAKLQKEGVKAKYKEDGLITGVAIGRILKNEKYVGDLVQGKTYTPDVLTHKKVKNINGQSSYYCITDHHPNEAIVTREVWDKAQKILIDTKETEEQIKKRSNRYWCSGKVYCGECGNIYVSHCQNEKSGLVIHTWICLEKHTKGKRKTVTLDSGESIEVGCNNIRVNDRILRQGMRDIIQLLFKPNFQEYYDKAKAAFTSSLDANTDKTKKEIEKLQESATEINNTLTSLTIKYAEGKISEQHYNDAMSIKNKEAKSLQDKLDVLSKTTSENSRREIELESKLSEIKRIINLDDEEVNDTIYSNIINKIVVYPENILEYHFNGISRAVKLQYKTKGKGKTYMAEFTVIDEE